MSAQKLLPDFPPRPPVRNTELSEEVSPRVVNKQLREVFREAFDHLGGAAWLIQFAQANDQNARVFVQAISKLLPPNAADDKNKPLIIDVPWLTRERLSYRDTEDAQIISIKEG